jgi:hypothetical protein
LIGLIRLLPLILIFFLLIILLVRIGEFLVEPPALVLLVIEDSLEF